MINTFKTLFWKKVGLDFARTFLAFLVPGLATVYNTFVDAGIDAGQVALMALVVASFSASLRGVQAALTTWESPPE